MIFQAGSSVRLFLGVLTSQQHTHLWDGSAETVAIPHSVADQTRYLTSKSILTPGQAVQALFPLGLTGKVIIAFKEAIREFTISLSPTRTRKRPERNRVQITCNTSCADHVQHASCHVVRRDSTAIKFDSLKSLF